MRLRDDTALDVIYRDNTPGGSPTGRRPTELGRRIFAPMLDHVANHGWSSVLASIDGLLETVCQTPAFSETADLALDGTWRLRPEILHPDPGAAQPAGLVVRGGTTGALVDARVPTGDWPAIHDLIARLDAPGGIEHLDGPHAAFVAALESEGLLEPVTDDESIGSGVTFVGHNTVVVRSDQAAVITDPFLLVGEPSVPEYQPLPRRLLGPIDAVLLTHTHPDHFDPASLLRFDASTAMIVPCIERESLLTVDMAHRLRQFGFVDVRRLEWWKSTKIGDLKITALPFYGEQPTDGPVLHPAVRNEGNTYLVEQPGMSVAFLADSGRDRLGDVRQVADQVGAQGRVDIVFSGYRGWEVYPAELLLSSVIQYLLFVPPSQWKVRQRLMNGPDEAVDTAERFGGGWLVPYAAGGAPWHWTRGLGPVLAGEREERVGFDPFPERVEEVAAHRGVTADGATVASPVGVRVLRPGDRVSVGPTADGFHIHRRPGYGWPW